MLTLPGAGNRKGMCSAFFPESPKIIAREEGEKVILPIIKMLPLQGLCPVVIAP
jgi:hypothetical protein